MPRRPARARAACGNPGHGPLRARRRRDWILHGKDCQSHDLKKIAMKPRFNSHARARARANENTVRDIRVTWVAEFSDEGMRAFSTQKKMATKKKMASSAV